MCKTEKLYTESKNYSENIMTEVSEVLKNEGYNCEIKSSGAEVVISKSGKSKDSIFEMIAKNLMVPKVVLLVLLDIVSVDGDIYIRQKTK